jgi:hypothetical protein
VSTLLVAVIAVAVGVSFARHLDELTSIVNFGALTGFLLLHLAVIRHHVMRGGSHDYLRHLVMPLAGFAVIGYVLYEMDSAAKIMGAAWITVGIVYFAVLSLLLKRRPALEL